MLFLLFTLGESRYGLDTSQIIEVVPMVNLTKLPHAPDAIAGCLNYRGTIVPVIDLQKLTVQEPCGKRLSTRIIVVNFKTAAGTTRPLGLLAERVTDAVHIAAEDFKPTGITLPAAPYLGSVALQNEQLIQCLNISRLLPRAVQDNIFGA